MDAAAELGRNPASKHRVWRMSRPRRDGTTEPVSRDHILRHVRGQGDIHFPCSADHKQDCQPTRLIHTLLCVMTIHTYCNRRQDKKTRSRWGGGGCYKFEDGREPHVRLPHEMIPQARTQNPCIRLMQQSRYNQISFQPPGARLRI